MSARNVLVLDKKDSGWFDFLGQFLEDTPSQFEIAFDSQSAGTLLERTNPSMAFLNPELVSPLLKQKLKAVRASCPEFYVFTINARFRNPPSPRICRVKFYSLILTNCTL